MNDATDTASRSPREASDARGKALANGLFNAALAALFSALFVQAGELPSSMWEPLGAGSFPRLVLGALVLFNVALLLQSVNAWRRSDAACRTGTLAWFIHRRLAFATLATFALYAALMPWVGFTVASFLFLLGVQWILGARRGQRLLTALIVSVLFSVGLHALFSQVFLISLPPGRLF
ncbi:tripartite tricarboxylate transporter TctB family protein [Salinicola avicenniae]|uniref:tripartite tricarboxylate transporter TctB family protein n=1 Tax=Salinicola avicenniae TaxID=2916836 RepID=UPI0020735652|nr:MULTISPECIES: tripartite tricarboxylate transporter TctB family protein [unclassified Salinicola]